MHESTPPNDESKSSDAAAGGQDQGARKRRRLFWSALVILLIALAIPSVVAWQLIAGGPDFEAMAAQYSQSAPISIEVRRLDLATSPFSADVTITNNTSSPVRLDELQLESWFRSIQFAESGGWRWSIRSAQPGATATGAFVTGFSSVIHIDADDSTTLTFLLPTDIESLEHHAMLSRSIPDELEYFGDGEMLVEVVGVGSSTQPVVATGTVRIVE